MRMTLAMIVRLTSILRIRQVFSFGDKKRWTAGLRVVCPSALGSLADGRNPFVIVTL